MEKCSTRRPGLIQVGAIEARLPPCEDDGSGKAAQGNRDHEAPAGIQRKSKCLPTSWRMSTPWQAGIPTVVGEHLCRSEGSKVHKAGASITPLYSSLSRALCS